MAHPVSLKKVHQIHQKGTIQQFETATLVRGMCVLSSRPAWCTLVRAGRCACVSPVHLYHGIASYMSVAASMTVVVLILLHIRNGFAWRAVARAHVCVILICMRGPPPPPPSPTVRPLLSCVYTIHMRRLLSLRSATSCVQFRKYSFINKLCGWASVCMCVPAWACRCDDATQR